MCAKCLDYIRKSLLREGSGKFRVGGRVCQVGTEGCWENLEARSVLILIYAPQSLVLGCHRYYSIAMAKHHDQGDIK